MIWCAILAESEHQLYLLPTRTRVAATGQIQDILHVRNLRRYREILRVLMRYGISEAFMNLAQGRLISAELSPVSIRAALCELGPAYIKLGQALASRPEILSLPFREEFAKLRDEVPPCSFSLIKCEIEKELGKSLDSLFVFFDQRPIASGSIGQVHRARLHDGTEVAVKVQRPGLHESVVCDSEIIRSLITLRRSDSSNGDRVSRLITEFLSIVEGELDYGTEADNMDRFLWQFEGEPDLRIPRVIRSYSSRRVLTMTYLPGAKLCSMTASVTQRRDVAKQLARSVLAQIFRHGYFHGDPHSANVAHTADHALVFYDFGVAGELTREERRLTAQILLALQQQHVEMGTHALLQLATSADPIDVTQLRSDLAAFTVKYFQTSAPVAAHAFLLDILTVTEKHGLVLPAGFYLLVRVLIALDATGRELDASFDLAQLSLPVLREAAVSHERPPLDTNNLSGFAEVLMDQFEHVPAALRDTLLQLNQGRLRIQFEHRGLEKAVHAHGAASRRLGLLILLSAMTLATFAFLCALILSKMIPLGPAIMTGACIASCTGIACVLICTVGYSGSRVRR